MSTLPHSCASAVLRVLVLCSSAVLPAAGQAFRPDDGFPAINDTLVLRSGTLDFPSSPVPIEIVAMSLTSVGPSAAPPGLSDPPAISNFSLIGFLDIGTAFEIAPGPRALTGSGMESMVLLSDDGTTRVFETEMLQLQLSDGSGLLLRESPTEASTGQTTITDIGSGLYRIDSFFDVFTEISLDGGQTWRPQISDVATGSHFDNQSSTIPEPSTWLIGLALPLACGAEWMRRRHPGHSTGARRR